MRKVYADPATRRSGSATIINACPSPHENLSEGPGIFISQTTHAPHRVTGKGREKRCGRVSGVLRDRHPLTIPALGRISKRRNTDLSVGACCNLRAGSEANRAGLTAAAA